MSTLLLAVDMGLFEDELREFLDDAAAAERPSMMRWIEIEGLTVFVRKSIRFVDRKKVTCLDLANINVEVRGRGAFRAVLEVMQRCCPWDGVWIENVLIDRLADHLHRRREKEQGWHYIPDMTFYWEAPRRAATGKEMSGTAAN